jgi:CPA2 family monovalent cation:H+ antiporter-2
MHQVNLSEIVILLSAAVAVVAVFKRLSISPILAYLSVGIVIGPFGLSIISDTKNVEFLGELGVVFLLFMIGLELSFERLIHMRKHVFGFGSLQVIITGAIIGYIAYLIVKDTATAIVIGAGLALSSTAVILEVLKERGEEVTQHGRLSLANLILQDLAFVPLLIMVPLLGASDSAVISAVTESIWKAALVLAFIVLVGKRLLGPLYNAIASTKSDELFNATTLLIILGSAWVTQYMGLSLAMGAFVAGLLVAETQYRTQVEIDLKPFKGLLMGLFFIAIGMKIDYQVLVGHISLIIGLTASLVIIKACVVFTLARIFKFSQTCSLKAGLLLAQASEFSFVLFGLAFAQDVISKEVSEILILLAGISIAITPMMAHLGGYLSKKIKMRNAVHMAVDEVKSEVSDLQDHVIVIGFDKAGRVASKLLREREIEYAVLDQDPRNVHQGTKDGVPIFFGRAINLDALESIGLARAKMVAITIAEEKMINKAVEIIRKNYPKMNIVCRAKDREHADYLREIGANVSIAEAFESSLMVGNFILTAAGVPAMEVDDSIERLRIQEHPTSQIQGLNYTAKDKI